LSWASNHEQWRASFTFDLPLVFDICDTGLDRYVTGDNTPDQLAETVDGTWVEFVKNGQPARRNLPKWSACNLDRLPVMRLDIESGVEDDPAGDERKLWTNVRIGFM